MRDLSLDEHSAPGSTAARRKECGQYNHPKLPIRQVGSGKP